MVGGVNASFDVQTDILMFPQVAEGCRAWYGKVNTWLAFRPAHVYSVGRSVGRSFDGGDDAVVDQTTRSSYVPRLRLRRTSKSVLLLRATAKETVLKAPESANDRLPLPRGASRRTEKRDTRVDDVHPGYIDHTASLMIFNAQC